MDLNNAIQIHAVWKFRLRDAIHAEETMDVAAISKDNNCELGKWLHGEARALYGTNAIYAKCLADHAAFHTEAGKIAGAINAKKKAEAERMLSSGSAFSQISQKVTISIVELKQHIRV